MKIVSEFVTLHEDQDYCIDNNEKVLGKTVRGLKVYKPSKVKDEEAGSFLVLVLSKQHYREMASQLQGFGLVEGEDFMDGRLLLLIHEGGYVAHRDGIA